MKKTILLLTIAFSLCAINKAASQDVASGVTGECVWTVTGTSGNYTLTISGNGTMADYTGKDGDRAPWYAWRNGIKTVDIKQGVTSVGGAAFYECKGLTSVVIPNSATKIGDKTFYNSRNLVSVIIGSSVTAIGNQAFYNCTDLTSVVIPNSVTTIGNAAFAYCSDLTSVALPNSVTAIGTHAFTRCSSLTSVIIPNSVTAIGSHAFSGCDGLLSAIVGNAVTTIGHQAFYECRALHLVTVGSSVATIGDYAFGWCTNVTELYIRAQTPPQLGEDVFGYMNKNLSVHVPCETTDVYQSAAGWDYFGDYVADVAEANIIVKSSDPTMGTAIVKQRNTCTENVAVIEAIAKGGYRFVQWHDGNTDNPRTVTVTEDVIFIADFDIKVGITEVVSSTVVAYPNPVRNVLHIRSAAVVEQVGIYDLCGKPVKLITAPGREINVSDLASGLYLVRITTADGETVRKIVIGN
ncbi:MAG: leucine-rich repeat protein [Prevotellaceae bacterium]|jgi:hypothetical protein|nr:leucine-rich repeat protein [Prevotellaceae bacterium]